MGLISKLFPPKPVYRTSEELEKSYNIEIGSTVLFRVYGDGKDIEKGTITNLFEDESGVHLCMESKIMVPTTMHTCLPIHYFSVYQYEL